jgi:hypothetical protein
LNSPTCNQCDRPLIYAKAYFAGRPETLLLDPTPDKSGNVRLTSSHSAVLMGEGQALAYHVKGEKVYRQHGAMLCSYYLMLNARKRAA